MRVYIGSDHAGYDLKNHLVGWLKDNGHDVVDCGPFVFDAEDDYPPFVPARPPEWSPSRARSAS